MDNDSRPNELYLDLKQAQAAVENRDVLYDDLYWQVLAYENRNSLTT